MTLSGVSRELPPGNAGKPSVWVWVIIAFALIIQQGAFIEMPALVGTPANGVPSDANVYNTAGIAISSSTIGMLCFLIVADLGYLARKNILSLIYIALVLISVGWSIHPDLTLRRAFGYVLSMAIAAYLVAAFDDVQRMKLVSAGFAVAAVGSFAYVAAFPNDGIMNIITLEGTWRGVFTHKNVLGPVMSVAAFTEIYVLTATGGRPRWRFILLGMYLALVMLSRSATAILLCTTFTASAVLYLIWNRDRLLAMVAGLILLLTAFLAVFVLVINPEFALGLLGKDASLTGRTELWQGVVRLIGDRPILGYGYRSMWSAGDSYRVLMDELTGGWGVTSSHNAFLEITLELGLLGMTVILLIIAAAIWRSIQCCLRSNALLGWLSLVYFITMICAGQTFETLGLNQDVFWLMFSILFLGCGMSLAPRRRQATRVRYQLSLAGG